ncbi:MAG: septal ring lytic transglycosylase RlpA family protein [Rhodocyclaceae bacterium]|nr:septal ring lytic transglycosylase RlpA family protein [Rhodocyclaceae bacterium]
MNPCSPSSDCGGKWRHPFAFGASFLLLACSVQPPRPAAETSALETAAATVASLPPAAPVNLPRKGGYYLDDGPLDPTLDLSTIPDAIPRVEPLHRFANRPYSVFGREYRPLAADASYRAEGIASWYGRRYHGQPTSSGERYDMFAMTAAHPTLPIPSYARVTNPTNGRSIVVRINDRGPFLHERLIDLSYVAAWKLGLLEQGSGKVIVERVFPAGAPTPPLAAATNGRAGAAPETAPATIEDRIEGDAHWLQLGAFSSRENAEALRAKLILALGDMGEKLSIRASANLYKLQLGPWRDAREARAVAETLKNAFALESVVVR